MGVALLSTTCSVPLAKSLLPLRTAVGSASLEDLVPLGRTHPPGDTIILLDLKLRLPPSRFVIFTPLNQWAKEGVTILTGMIYINCNGKIVTTK